MTNLKDIEKKWNPVLDAELKNDEFLKRLKDRGDSDTIPIIFTESFICFSGGSKGADQIFGECAEKVGHLVVHWSFGNHFSPCKPETIRPLSYPHLLHADKHLVKANERIKHTFPTRSEYVNNLLRRNYYQIYNSDRIYASTALNDKGIPFGGTAWAFVMGVDRGIKEIYTFDYNKDKWYSLRETTPTHYLWDEIELKDIPKPIGRYAGIGSSELPANGCQAIMDLYGV